MVAQLISESSWADVPNWPTVDKNKPDSSVLVVRSGTSTDSGSSRSGYYTQFFLLPFCLKKIIDIVKGQIDDPSLRKNFPLPTSNSLVSVLDP